ncbi:TonB-dependent receptor [Pseudoalteromonas sp. MMG022]|uniref:TonB-dependent receptor n=1 Tax=Pseudoalteromonas sp. MMG022 TaxID=2909978 RepID=UPI001EFFBE14|nr:TonB-dependent receptor [Pseudoalteromonas sp. MMG022]MCF6433998.1 TonB-dependent receptor [Pseudoalteromonas sp. MMG022]
MKPSNFSKSKVALAMASALFISNVCANTIQGRVTSEAHDVYFQGAKITIKELKRSTVSNRDGVFKLTNLPQGDYTLVVDYLGAQTFAQTVRVSQGNITTLEVALSSQLQVLEDVIVVGHRAGQAGALNRQKNALGITSIASSDAIGQLPDQNAAQALQRLPGLYIQRDQGEGRFVGIRGIDPNLNNVTINGANVPSPEAGVRSVAMDVIPSELIQSLEVSKTVTPDMDASAIGGSIEVKSLSAFDRAGQSYSANIQTTYNSQVEKYSPKLSGSFSDTFKIDSALELGLATAFSWSERKFGSYNMETDAGWQQVKEGVYSAEEIEQRHYKITRERTGAALNLDLRDKNANSYYLRSLFSEFSDDEYRQRNEYKFDKGELVSGSLTHSSALFGQAEMDRDTKDRYETQKITSFVLGTEQQLDEWFVEASFGHSKSSEDEPNRLDVSFAGEDMFLGYASLGQTPILTRSISSHQLEGFELDEVVTENNFSEDKATSFKFDVSKDLVVANYNTQIKFGAKYSKREKYNQLAALIYDGGFDDISASVFEQHPSQYSLGDFGPGLSRDALRDYVANNKQHFDINVLETDVNSLTGTYQSNEAISAAYFMFTIDIDRWQILSGLRYESTDFDTTGNKVELVEDKISDTERVDINVWSVQKQYDHLMPNLTVRYELQDQLVTRFAYTNTLARPKFSDSAAYQLIETERSESDGNVQFERKAEVGNPYLDPYESDNIDLSVEYYPSGIGVISAGVFYKDISNFNTSEQVQNNGNWPGYEEVVQVVNGGSAQMTGVELAYIGNYSNGIVLSANGTFIDADGKLPSQSDTVANMMVGYDANTYSARLSASYKSKSFVFNEGDERVYQDAHLQLDFSAKYKLSEQTQVYFNATNLTDEPYYLYHGSRDYNYQYETYGRSFELGVSFNSL